MFGCRSWNAKRFALVILVSLTAGCVCSPWGDVQERGESTRDSGQERDGILESYDAILGWQCRSLMHKPPPKKQPKSDGEASKEK